MKLPKKNIKEVGNGRVIARYSEYIDPADYICNEVSKNNLSIAMKALMTTRDENTRCYDKFISMATADSADTYDQRKGCDLASIKCDLKFHRAVVKQCEKAIRKLELTIGELRAVQRRHLTKIYNIENDIARYYRGEKV